MKTLPAELVSLLDDTCTEPFFLVELGFSTPLRLSSGRTVSYDGEIFSSADVELARLSFDANMIASGAIIVGNTDNAINYWVLHEGISGKPVKVWLTYMIDDTNFAEPVLVFDGIGDAVRIDHTKTEISIVNKFLRVSHSPRRRICAASGFNHLPAPGTRITWKNETFVLEGR